MQTASPRLRRFATTVLASTLFVGVSTLPILFVGTASAQTGTTGAVTGVVTDPSGAVIPGATITLTDQATGAVKTATANGQGRYSLNLLKPSNYTITVDAPGMGESKTTANILVGQTPSVNVTLTPGASSQNVTVSAQGAQLTDTQTPALVTTFTQQQVQDLPAPGGDITTVAFTAPGVVLNSGGAYGNFSSDGLPGVSNLYVLNGFDDEDPFLNLNNTGSSNLTLGQGEIAEAAVVQNGYSAQYGRAAGIILDFTTKSGGNAFHGAADYWYNGSILNANDYFRNQAGEGRPKAVSNQWAANVGGPILKNKLFFFADYEGLRYVLPASGYVAFPTAAFQSAILSRIPAANVPLYQQAFNLYNASPNFARAIPVVNGNGSNQLQDSSGTMGCGSAAALGIPDGTGGTFGTTSSCTSAALGTASNKNTEWLFTGRVDWNISDKQKLFGRYKMDHGSQPTYTSFISPLFNTVSSQPSYEGQLNDTYSPTANITNQFIFASNWYTAFFGPANMQATLAAFPTYLNPISDGGSDGSAASNEGPSAGTGNFPTGLSANFIDGRNVTDYQFVDDLTWVKGSNTLRFGYNFRRSDISDYDAQQNIVGTYTIFMSDFANGTLGGDGSKFTQQLATKDTAYLALYNVGAYLQDEWQATSRLKLTLGLRFDRTGNPLCNDDCFSLYNGSFPKAGVTTGTAYNTIVTANQDHPFNSVQSINPQGRFGFNYDVNGNGRTVIRGGVGMFTDLYPAGFLDGFIDNLPNVYSPVITTGNIGAATTAGTAAAASASSFKAIESGFASGASLNSLTAAVPAYSRPNFVTAASEFKNPTYIEFSMQLQRQMGRRDALILSYVGNTGYDEIIQNGAVNAYAPPALAPNGFAGFPTAQPDPNFGAVDNYTNAAHSNYNGGSVTYKHIDGRGLTADVTYTFSKSMDDASNSGITNEPFNYNSYDAGSSYQIDPNNVGRLNYSVSDYDVRNSLTADVVYEAPFKFQHAYENALLGGWVLSGKSFYRSGQPFTVYNGAASGANTGGTDLGAVLADFVNPSMNRHCSSSAVSTPCFTSSDFTYSGSSATSQTDLGNLPRNQFVGPHYADTDIAVAKKLYSRESMNLQIGANAFNVINHPNFALPSADISAGGFGTISSIAAPPTSPYGSFQGAGVGGRVLQVFGKFNF